jgi:hypothetical protein
MEIDNEKYIEYAMSLDKAFQTQTDVSSKTKAQLKEFATSIGLSVSSSLTKNAMLEAINASEEFDSFNLKQKENAKLEALKQFNAKYPKGYGI